MKSAEHVGGSVHQYDRGSGCSRSLVHSAVAGRSRSGFAVGLAPRRIAFTSRHGISGDSQTGWPSGANPTRPDIITASPGSAMPGGNPGLPNSDGKSNKISKS